VSGDRLARGTVFAMGAQVAAAALGFALTLFLARRLGPTLFGRYGVIISFLAWAEFLVITGIPDAAARAIAADDRRRRGIFRAGLRLEALAAVLLFTGFWLAAPWFSAALFHNPELTGAFRLAAVDIPFYALFALHIGYLRGVRGFARQSVAITVYAAMRFLCTAALVLAGLSLQGALLGNAAGSLAALVLARLLVTRDLRRAEESDHPAAGLAAYALPLVTGVLLFNALISVDLWMVERVVAVDGEVGLYTAIWNMARTPYFIFMGLSVVLFPGLSRVLAAGDAEKARRQVAEAVRLFLLIVLPLVAVAATTGSGLLGLAFSEAYEPLRSGPLFAVLIAGYALLSFGLIWSAALTAHGRPLLVAGINLGLLALQVVLTGLFIPRYGLSGAVMATLITGGISLFAGMVCLSGLFGVRPRLLTPLRALLAALAAAGVTLVLPGSGALLILAYAAAGLVYLAGLYILGEITRDELVGYGAQLAFRRSPNRPDRTPAP